jgi:hypothetical protein
MTIHPHDNFTWSDMLDRAARPSNWGSKAIARYATADFYGATLSEARRLLVEGWPEGRANMERGLSALAVPTIRTPTTFLDVAGFRPIVPVAIAGDPQCMVNNGLDATPRNTYRLAISNSVRGSVNHSAFTNRGIAICRIIDAMETAGHRVEVFADSTVTNISSAAASTRYSFSYTVKEADQPLEIDRIAFVFAHPAAHRCINFHMRELTLRHDELGSDPRGFSQDPRQDNHQDAIIFPHLDQTQTHLYATAEKALATLITKMRVAGLEIETHA